MAYTIKVLGRNKKKCFRSEEKENNNKLFGMSVITPGRINSLIRGKGQPRINTRKEFVIKNRGSCTNKDHWKDLQDVHGQNAQ